MTKKNTSADLFEVLKMDEVYTNGFDRAALRQAIWRVERPDASYPSEDSFIDWAMKHEKIKRVSPGNYEFMDHLREGVVVTDMDPENPMILPDEEEGDLDLDAFSELMSGLVEYLEEEQRKDELVQEIRDAADMRPENLYIIMDDVKRLPRKEKKRMKRELLRNTSAQKVTFSYLNWAS